MLVTGLFIISTSSWFSLGRFYFSKNLFTSSKLSVLLAHTARRSNQSILKEISPEYSLVGLMLKLKFQYFGHLMQRTDSFEKTLILGKIEGGRRRGWQRMRWLDGIADSIDMSLSKLRELVMDRACCSPWGHRESDMTEWLKWTELNIYMVNLYSLMKGVTLSYIFKYFILMWLI